MRVKLIRSYRSKKGNVTFVYSVTGTKEALAAFKKAQGEFYREDEKGNALWFTTRCIGQTGTLLITTNGNIVPDMSAFDQANSLAAQYGGNFGQTLAQTAAAMLLGTAPAAQNVSAPVANTVEAPAEMIEEDLSNV